MPQRAAHHRKRRRMARSARRQGGATARGERGRRRVSRAGASPRATAAGLTKKDGCDATLVVVERVGRRRDRVVGTFKTGAGGKHPSRRFHAAPKTHHRAAALDGRLAARLCGAMAALAHAARIRIIQKLLEGPATYRALKQLTKLKPGPLYHHITQLRLAALILPKRRDLYELTRGGRNVILGVMALAPLTRDRRRRPVG